MTENQNFVTELQGLIERQFSYMPSIVKKEIHEDILIRMGDWLVTHKVCGKMSVDISIKHMEAIEDFFKSNKINNSSRDRVSDLFDKAAHWRKR